MFLFTCTISDRKISDVEKENCILIVPQIYSYERAFYTQHILVKMFFDCQ